MSHFSVIVIGPNVEEQLAPYHEFECTGLDDQYVQNIDVTEKLRAEWNSETVSRYRDGDVFHDPHQDRFYRYPNPEEKKLVGMGSGCGHGLSWTSRDWRDGLGYQTKIHFVPEGMEEVKLTASEVMSFRDFVIYWQSDKEVLPGQTPDTAGQHKFRYTLISPSGDVESVIDRTNPNAKWDWYVVGGRYSGKFLVNGKERDDAIISDIQNLSDVTCFAMVRDGKWSEKGQMGWFAFVRNEKPDKEWALIVSESLASLPKDTLLTVVDCHI